MKFLKGFLVFFLIVIIVGGLGFIGYSTLFMNHSGHNMSSKVEVNSQQSNQAEDNSNGASHNQSSMVQNSTSGQQMVNSVALNQVNIVLQNKEKLNKSLTSLNEALKLLTVDPYAQSSNGTGNMQMQGDVQTPGVQGNPQNNIVTAPAQEGNNTTINIYPNLPEKASSSQQNTMNMQSMGTVYDPTKMEQLHNGLYKVSLGMALLNQLQDQLVDQAENSNSNTQDLAQYFTNQYSITTQHKEKLAQALGYINEAVSLININPYVSANGLVYDKDRMNQIHQSVVKLAEGDASLNLLNDDLTRQSIVLANTVQAYISNGAVTAQMNHSTMSNNLFEGINIQMVVNVLMIIFVIGLILGILGFTFSQIKPGRMASSETKWNDQPGRMASSETKWNDQLAKKDETL